MSDSKLTQTFTTNDSQLIASYEKVLRKQGDMLTLASRLANQTAKGAESGVRGLNDQAEAGDRLTASLESVSGGIGKMVAGYASAATAVKAFYGELEKARSIQKQVADAFTSMAAPRTAMRTMMQDATPQEFKMATDRIEAMAQRGLGDVRTLSNAMAALTSASPTLDYGTRLNFLETGAAASSPETAEDLSVGLSDASRLTGSKDAKENLGVILGVAQKSQSKDLGMVSRNIIPAAAQIREAYGGTPAEAAAFVTAIQAQTLDKTGESTRTASLQAAGQLHEYFTPEAIRARATKNLLHEGSLGPGEGSNPLLQAHFNDFMVSSGAAKANMSFADQLEIWKRSPELQEAYIANQQQQTAGISTPAQQLHYMQQHPDESKEFLAGFHTEERAKIPVQQFLSDANSGIAQNFENFSKEVLGGADAVRLAEQKLAEVANDQYVKMARINASLGATADRMERQQKTLGESGIARENLAKILDAGGVPNSGQLLDKVAFEFNTGMGKHDAFDELERQMLNRESQLRRHPKISGLGAMAGYEPGTAEELAVADALRQGLEQLRIARSGLTGAPTGPRRRMALPGGELAPDEPMGWGDGRLPHPPWMQNATEMIEPPAAKKSGPESIDWDAALGGLEENQAFDKGFDIADEFADLRAGSRSVEAFKNRRMDLSRLSVEADRAAEASKDPEVIAALREVAEISRQIRAELEKQNQKMDADANLSRAAHRATGARAVAASLRGRESPIA